MNGLRPFLVIAIVALVSASALPAFGSPSPGAQDKSLEPVEGTQDCAPPCGYIWPRIGVNSEIPNPYAMSDIQDFPSQAEITITYSWDMEQEGTGVPEPAEDMQILVIVSRTPAFLSAQLDRNVCEFTIIPAISEYEVCTLTLDIELDESALPTSEEQLREEGHRLMLFAASEESGTFMRSYGLEDIRFRFDDETSEVGVDGQSDVAESPLPAFALLTLGLVAAAGLRLRRR